MKNFSHRLKRILHFFILFLFIADKEALAYIDLGTGSYFFQILLAAILGFVFTLKGYWKRIKDFLTVLISKNKNRKNG